MRSKLTGLILGAIVAVAGFAAVGLTRGAAATSDTTTATTTGTTGTTSGSTTTGSTTTGSTTTGSTTTGSTTTGSTTTGSTTTAAASTVTVTVTNVETVILNPKVTLCHRVGRGVRRHFVLVRVAAPAVNSHLLHGDKPAKRGSCAAWNRALHR
jgi:hypothetical protein